MTSTCPHPRLATRMTIVPAADQVHLIAGEDTRYTLTVGEFASQFALLLRQCDGSVSEVDLLERIPHESRTTASNLIHRLYGERVLIDGGPEDLLPIATAEYRLQAEGEGPLVSRLQVPWSDQPILPVLCQSNLDFHAAYEFNLRCRKGQDPWLWVSTGAMDRAYVSPVFLPNAGPCLACLLRTFQRLSPAPMLYDVLVEHGKQGGQFEATTMPERGLAVVEQLVRWKVEQYHKDRPVIPVFRLHVLEIATMEVSVHRVFRDPTCPACSNAIMG